MWHLSELLAETAEEIAFRRRLSTAAPRDASRAALVAEAVMCAVHVNTALSMSLAHLTQALHVHDAHLRHRTAYRSPQRDADVVATAEATRAQLRGAEEHLAAVIMHAGTGAARLALGERIYQDTPLPASASLPPAIAPTLPAPRGL